MPDFRDLNLPALRNTHIYVLMMYKMYRSTTKILGLGACEKRTKIVSKEEIHWMDISFMFVLERITWEAAELFNEENFWSVVTGFFNQLR